MVNLGEVRRAQLAKSTLLTSTLVLLGIFSDLLRSDAKERVGCGKQAEAHYRSYISPPLVPISSKFCPVSRITTSLPQIHFNFILPSTSRPPLRAVFLRFFPLNLYMHFWIVPYVLRVMRIKAALTYISQICWAKNAIHVAQHHITFSILL